jgi:glycosyltransferase involved in cell wall biosynthesis
MLNIFLACLYKKSQNCSQNIILMKIIVIIPAFNEAKSIAKVVQEIPKDLVHEIVVVNNNSSDETSEMARQAGATVLDEFRQGYGFACLKGIEYAKKQNPDMVVFLDADYSDYPEEMRLLIKPIIDQNYDMVIGSRALGKRQFGSMTIPQIFGNWLATNLLRLFYSVEYSDLGPFRAIKFEQLLALNMQDTTYGWTVEMQVKAAKMKMKTTEIAVNYKRRIGKSKVSGTVKGTILAGYKIIITIFKYL